jgi:hypothetical protein
VVAAEPHNGRAPHFRLVAGDLGHQRQQPKAIAAPDRLFHCRQELLDGRAGRLGPVFRHGGSFPDGGVIVSRSGRVGE